MLHGVTGIWSDEHSLLAHLSIGSASTTTTGEEPTAHSERVCLAGVSGVVRRWFRASGRRSAMVIARGRASPPDPDVASHPYVNTVGLHSIFGVASVVELRRLGGVSELEDDP